MVTQPYPRRKTDKPEPRLQGPNVLWTANLKTPEAKEEFYQLMAISNGPVLQRLLEIISTETTRVENDTLRVSKYDSPQWAYIQADNVGYKRALRLVEELLKGIVK